MDIKRGYTNIYRPPYVEEHRSTIYCIGGIETPLIIIPLTPAFFNDLVAVAVKSNNKEIVIIAPDIGAMMISDLYNAYNYLTQLKKKVKIASMFMPELRPSAFNECITCTMNATFSYDLTKRGDLGDISEVVNIQLLYDDRVQASSYVTDIYVQDTTGANLFVSQMTIEKAKILLPSLEEKKIHYIHMPYSKGNYAGVTYTALIEELPDFKDHVICHSFINEMEKDEAKALGLLGKEFYS